MAAWMNVVTVIQEQNSYPGIATRRLAGTAEKVYLGFDEARKHISSSADMITTGNPVRGSISKGDREAALNHFGLARDRKTILVLGGSQGARSVNRAVMAGLKAGDLPANFQLLWQTGKLDHDTIVAEAGEHAKTHRLFAFEERMDLVYAAADLVVARAGAITLAEIQACRLPSVLIPYPFAAGDHQRHNARTFAERGWAVVIDPKDLENTDLLKQAVTLFENGEAVRMQQAMEDYTAGQKPAVDVIAEDIIELLTRRQGAKVDN
jgi:UDP-N-acetylglucosamine--N-acetylmuramyl-(pentapeptide) pyrophosphoryl-undecaprenol N-acetylglucosamine transferase